MRIFACHYDEQSSTESAVGLIVLQSDEVMEAELRAWLPPHLRLLHTRIPNDTHVSADTLCAMEEELPKAAGLLPAGVDYKVIGYGCTSASTLIGEARVAAMIHRVLPGVAVTNPITALKAQLQSLDIARIALLTPYSQAVSSAIVEHLQASGIEIVQAGTFDEANDDRVARIAGLSVLEAMIELGGDERCQAVFGSCTNLRSMAFLTEARERIGKPVITSNSALAWHIEQLAGVTT